MNALHRVDCVIYPNDVQTIKSVDTFKACLQNYHLQSEWLSFSAIFAKSQFIYALACLANFCILVFDLV